MRESPLASAGYLLVMALASPWAAYAAGPNECGSKPPTAATATPKLDKGDVYGLAIQAAKDDGYLMKDYVAPVSCFKSKSGEWLVSFRGRGDILNKPPPPAFEVTIADATKKSKVRAVK